MPHPRLVPTGRETCAEYLGRTVSEQPSVSRRSPTSHAWEGGDAPNLSNGSKVYNIAILRS